MALPNAVIAIVSLMLNLFPLTVLLLCFSSFPGAAQSASPKRGQLPHHDPAPAKSNSLRKPHGAAGPQLHLPVQLYQSTLHPQQHRAVSAPKTEHQFGTATFKDRRQPVGHTSQLPSSPGLLCGNEWSSTCKQNHPTYTQVRADIYR